MRSNRYSVSLAAAVALCAAVASAHDYKLGEIVVDHPWARANTLPDRPTAGYAVIRNKGSKPARLLSATSPEFERIEIHRHVMEGGASSMERMESLEIPAGGEIMLAPGGYHLMLIGPRGGVSAGDMLPLTLVFEDHGAVSVDAHVEGWASVIQQGSLTISDPVIFVNIEGRPSAGYFTVDNHGASDDRLVGAVSDSFERIELHTHVHSDGVVAMSRIDSMTAPAHGALKLASGGQHLMLFEPNRALTPGDRIPIILRFEKAGEITLPMELRAIGDRGAHSGQFETGEVRRHRHQDR